MENYSGFSGWTLKCNHMYPYKKKKIEIRHTGGGRESNRIRQAKMGVLCPQAKEYWKRQGIGSA